MKSINEAFSKAELLVQEELRRQINETPITEGNIDRLTQLQSRLDSAKKFEARQVSRYKAAKQNEKAMQSNIF